MSNHVQGDIRDHLTQRRSSYNIEYGRPPRANSGSASKVDLLKSALEINHQHRTSNPSVMTRERNSNHSLSRNRADSAPKLNPQKNISIPNVPVLEVSPITTNRVQ